jgi:hypothetical protein
MRFYEGGGGGGMGVNASMEYEYQHHQTNKNKKQKQAQKTKATDIRTKHRHPPYPCRYGFSICFSVKKEGRLRITEIKRGQWPQVKVGGSSRRFSNLNLECNTGPRRAPFVPCTGGIQIY